MFQSTLAFVRAALSTMLTLVTLTLCMVWIRLSAAPVQIDGFAVEARRKIAEQLERSAPGWNVRIGGIALAWERTARRPGVRLSQIALIDPTGAVAFRAPSVSIGLDLSAALSDGRVEPTSLTVHGAELVFVRTADGAWRFDLAAPAAATERSAQEPDADDDATAGMFGAANDLMSSEEQREDIARLIDAITGSEPFFGVLGDLNKIDVVGAGVTYRDDLTDAYLRAEKTRLELQLLEGGGLRLTAQALLEIEEPVAENPKTPGSKEKAARRIERARQALTNGRTRAKISLVGERLREAREASLSVRFEDAPLHALTAQFHDLDALQALEGFVSGEALATLSLDSGDLVRFSAALRGEGAQFAALRRRAEAARRQSGEEGKDVVDPLALSAFSARFDYAPESDSVLLKRLEITGDRLEAALEGDARFLRNDQGAAIGAKGALRILNAKVLDPQLFASPLLIETGGFEFTLEGGAPGSAEAPRLWMRALELETPELKAAGEARVLFEAPRGPAAKNQIGAALGLRADLDLDLNDFELARMPRFWPLPAAPGARDWIAENIRAGWIRGGRVEARIGGGAGFGGSQAQEPKDKTANRRAAAARETIDFGFKFDGVSSSYLGDMTPVTGASGVGRVEADHFEAKFHKAKVDLGEDGAMSLDGSRFTITSFEPEYPPSTIAVRSDGPVRALLALLDQEPLALTRKLDLKPSDFKGRAKGVSRLSLPLKKDLPAEEVKIEAEGVVKKLEMPVHELDGARASIKRATIKVNGDRLRLKGETKLEGYEDHRFEADWLETFSPAKGRPSTVLTATRRFSAAALEELGAPEDWELDGVAALALRIEKARSGEAQTKVEVALDDLAMQMPWIGWEKKRGQKGIVEAKLVRENDRLALTDLRMVSAGLTAEGAAAFDDRNALREVSLTSMKTEAGTDVALRVEIAEDGAVALTGGGARLHVNPSVGAAEAKSDAASEQARGVQSAPAADSADGRAKKRSEPRLSLNMQFDRVTLGEGNGLKDVAVALARSDRGGFYFDLSGKTPGGFLSGSARPEPDGVTRYKLNTDDLGGLLVAMGAVAEADRGEARIEAVQDADGEVKGLLKGSNLVVKSAPAIADALSVVSVVGIFDLASTGGITFTDIEAPFSMSGDELVIEQFTAKGPSLGVTAKGRLQTEHKVLDIRGQVSPAFVLNGLPGELPVIGRILTGGEGKGIIGFSFALKGQVDDPKVEVNPLSAFAPGPLRGIFGG